MSPKRLRENGASLVEVGLLLPILILLAIGLSEVTFLVVDYLTVTNAAREGARVGAAAADYDAGSIDADDLILNAVEEAACNLNFGTLETVTIYRADASGEIPIPPGGSVNEYSNSGSLQCGSSGHGLSCTNGCPWAPSSRDRVPPDFDVLGVEIIFTHSSVTGFFPFPTVDWNEKAVMQIEPDTRGQQ
ncbi:MAG TPA: TadE/TadG family type IV pilus assembly protein [Acidimicrobiia bacterium]|nr:TadE/TadG family type IV pilus assembly protein [Acidimicrobiia bacterium]